MDGLKIVALIGTPAHLNYFVNTVNDRHKIHCVIRENSRMNLWAKIYSKGIFKSFKIVFKTILNAKKLEAIYDKILGEKWRALNPELEVCEVSDINSEEVRKKLLEIQPDVIIVQGTTMIKNATLKDFSCVLNLHWGLSPYYKGSYCTEWAMINQDIHNIGYTIHKISVKIDGGDIITQGRPIINNTDSAVSINMKLTRDGSKTMTKVIDELINGNSIKSHPQGSKGRLFLTRQWTSVQERQLKSIESNMSQLLENSSKDLVPIVELK